MMDKYSPLEPDCTYHIYNRAIGDEKLFLSKENYRFFLQKYSEYVAELTHTFCYCLMPNHFHFLMRVKSEKEIKEAFKERNIDITDTENLTALISKQFSNLFNSYAKSFNRKNNRKGGLFIRPFKRKKVTNENYLLKLIHYIHYNPIEANLVEQADEWEFSSFSSLISDKKTKLNRKEVIELFEDKNNFIYCHQIPPQLSGIEEF